MDHDVDSEGRELEGRRDLIYSYVEIWRILTLFLICTFGPYCIENIGGWFLDVVLKLKVLRARIGLSTYCHLVLYL